MLIVGATVPEADELLVGKGLYTQIQDFGDENWDFEEDEWIDSGKLALVVSEVTESFYVDEVTGWEENNTQEWSSEYGRIITNGGMINIGNYIGLKSYGRTSEVESPGSSKIKPMLVCAVALGVI